MIKREGQDEVGAHFGCANVKQLTRFIMVSQGKPDG